MITMKKLISGFRFQTYLPCILSGLLFGLSFPSYPYVRLEVLAWFWMAPLLLSLKQVQSFPRFLGRVYLAAFITCVFGMSWLMASTVKGALLLFFVGGVVFTVPFVGFYFVRRTFGWRAALWTAPVIWTAWDWLYHRSDGSFGWLTMGVSQSNLNWLVQYVDITGVWGITFWLVLFNVLIVMAVENWQAARARGGQTQVTGAFLARRLALISGLMLAVPLSYSAYVFTRAALAPQGKELSVLLVQPNANPWERLAATSRPVVLRKTIGMTNRALAASESKPDLIIWPETAVPYVLAEDKDAREIVYRSITLWETPLLTGLLDARTEPDRREVFNGAALLSPAPEEPGKRFNVESSPVYHKRVLMPFVERVPFVDRFPALQRLAIDIGAGDGVSRGSEATVFSFRTRRGDQATVAAAICYEYLYPAEVAELVKGGAQMVALITNEGWFSKTHGEYQMAAFSRLRSIETRRAMARTANTGLTWLVDSLGRVHEQAPWWSEQTLAGKIALSDEMSLYVRYTDYFPKACAWLTLALLLATSIQQIGRRTGQRLRRRTRQVVQSLRPPAGKVSGWREEDCLE